MKKIVFLFLMLILVSMSACSKDEETVPTDNPTQVTYLYNDFSPSEKNKMTEVLGEVIPFLASNAYYFECENGVVSFETLNNTETDFNSYKEKLVSNGYVYTSWSVEEGHRYEKNVDSKTIVVIIDFSKLDGVDYFVAYAFIEVNDAPSVPTPTVPSKSAIQAILEEAASLGNKETLSGERTVTGTVKEIKESYTEQYKNISFVLTDGVADILVWRAKGDCASSLTVGSTVTVIGEVVNYDGTIEFQYPQISGDSSNPDTPVVPSYLYTDFTSDEKLLFDQYLGGEVIPFLPNNEYVLEGYYEETDYENGFYFMTTGNTKTEFNDYLKLLVANGYEYHSEEADDYGDIWYTYIKNDDFIISAVWYEYEGETCVDIVAYSLTYSEGGSGSDEPTVPSESTIQSILDEAASLGNKETLFGDRTVTGTVKEIKENYTEQYKNISFVLTDGTADILVWRAKGDCASTLTVGSTVTVTGTVINYDGTIEFQYPQISGDSNNPDTPVVPSYLYTDFTSNEKALFKTYIGEVIPFIPNNEYYVEGYYDVDDYENGMCFYTAGNTQAEFDNYRKTLVSNGYIYETQEADEYGDVWYTYIKNDDIVIDVVGYEYEGEYWINVFVYSLTLSGDDAGGDDDGGTVTDVDLITNDGKGLPTSSAGVYEVDFKDATYVKNVTQQGYYLDGCPTTGDVKALVIPVDFSDRTAASLGYDLNRIDLAFNGVSGTTNYRSVSEYYFTSSNGKLDLEFVVLDSWYRAKNTSSYYLEQTMEYYESYVEIGDQMLIDEALAYLESRMDLSEFDSDNNSIIDAVIIVHTLEIDADVTLQWAYRYWNIYTDSDGYYYEYDGVSANDYLWASYQFLMEDYDEEGNTIYSNNVINPYTYIHEFGHVLGADDYYDTSYNSEPLLGCDMMDSMMGDHNPFTKFNYGWITTSRLVVAEESVTLTLQDFSKTGDTIIIANNWDPALGVYQEYYVLMYYTMTGLNGGEFGYFASEGIVVYHVNASLYAEELDGETYYDIYNNNTDGSDKYGTYNNLIEFAFNREGNIVHTVGMTSSNTTIDDNGNKISYIFTVDKIEGDIATLTFTKNN